MANTEDAINDMVWHIANMGEVMANTKGKSKPKGAFPNSEGALANTEGALANTEGALANTEGALVNTEGALVNTQKVP